MCSLKLLTCNIEGDKHLEQVIALLKAERPDVVCLQEVLGQNVSQLKEALSMEGEFVPTMLINEENAVGFPAGSEWGVLMMTNQKDATFSKHFYVRHADGIPNFGYMEPNATNRVLLVSDIVKDTTLFRIITTHFTWTPDGKASDEQREDFSSMLKKLDSYSEFVLCGDFNAPRGEEIWDTLAGRYQDTIPSDITTTIDPTVHRVTTIQLVVDGIFTTSEYEVSEVKLFDGVSDHKPISAIISKH